MIEISAVYQSALQKRVAKRQMMELAREKCNFSRKTNQVPLKAVREHRLGSDCKRLAKKMAVKYAIHTPAAFQELSTQKLETYNIPAARISKQDLQV